MDVISKKTLLKIVKMLYLYLYSALQIILESLPISSSGHSTLLEFFLQPAKTSRSIIFSQNLATLPLSSNHHFNHFLHLPTVFIVALFFFKSWYSPWRNLMHYALIYARGCASSHAIKRLKKFVNFAKRIIIFVLIADICTVSCYFMFASFSFLPHFIGIGFCITSLALLSLYFAPSSYTKKKSSLFDSVFLGLLQGLSLLPGISRLGLTFATARWLGYSPRRACHISFLIQWPLMVVGSMDAVFFMKKTGIHLPFSFFCVIAGSSYISYALLSFFYTTVKNDHVWRFGLYELIPLLIWSQLLL